MHQPSIFVIGATLLAVGTPVTAQADTGPTEKANPAQQDAKLITVSATSGQKQDAQQTPQAQPGTPPSERTPERAPANPAIRNYPRQADGHGIKQSGYNVSRWAEDWTAMRNPKKRDDFLDRLKYLPIDDKGDIYLTLSGEARLRTTFTGNPGLVDSDNRREDMLRLVGGADLHIGPVRFFGELAHGGLSGINYGAPAAKSRNDLFLQQAFGEISGTVEGVGLGIRYGRQEFTDGSSSLISQKDNNTLHAVEQGVRAWGQIDKYRVDVFDFRHVAIGMGGISDDAPDRSNRFSGVTAGVVLANDKTRKLFLDPFAWRERNDKVRWGTKTAHEVRHYYGARLWGSLDDLTIDWTVSHQTGDFNGRDIDAWSAAIAQTYALSAKGMKPKAGVHFDYGSGGGSYGTGALKTSKIVTAGTIAYSYQGALSPTNLFQISPNLTVTPVKPLDVTFEYQRSYRASDSDAVYKGSGSAYAGTQLIQDGDHIGDALRIQASWKIAPRLSLITRYEYFQPTGALKQVNTVDSHYLSSWISFRF
ncbi:alginate export family protein [Sphingomonas sp. MMS12-HWE2-04]|uniref:alginate export family protein n=1 Tax=Sphingomonas sp. MMS12-HWE2-04 TaxID=3234199 RepID=UPI0038517239